MKTGSYPHSRQTSQGVRKSGAAARQSGRMASFKTATFQREERGPKSQNSLHTYPSRAQSTRRVG